MDLKRGIFVSRQKETKLWVDPLSEVNADLEEQFNFRASEYDRCLSLQELIFEKFGVLVWDNKHHYDHHYDPGN